MARSNTAYRLSALPPALRPEANYEKSALPPISSGRALSPKDTKSGLPTIASGQAVHPSSVEPPLMRERSNSVPLHQLDEKRVEPSTAKSPKGTVVAIVDEPRASFAERLSKAVPGLTSERVEGIRDSVAAKWRHSTFHIKSTLAFVQPPERLKLPIKRAPSDVGSGRTMRLLWLIANMKNCDTIVVLPPSDAECLELCELISEVMPLVKTVRKLELGALELPQVVVSLHDPNLLDEVDLGRPPLVINKLTALESLIGQVLHPTAHWTGTLDLEFQETGERARKRWAALRHGQAHRFVKYPVSAPPSEKL